MVALAIGMSRSENAREIIQLRELVRPIALLHVYLISFAAPATTAVSFASEWERRRIESLRVTRLYPGAILLGKMGVALLPFFLLIAAGLVFALALYPLHPWPLFDPWVFVSVLAIYLLAFGCLGAICGILLRRTRRAAVAAELIVLAMWTALIWMGPLMHLVSNPTPIADVALHLNPVVALLWVLGDDPIRGTFLYRYDICPIGMYRFDYPTWLSVFGSYLAATLLLLGAAGRILQIAWRR